MSISDKCENCAFLDDDGLCNGSFLDGKLYTSDDRLIPNAFFYPDDDFTCGEFRKKENKKGQQNEHES